MENERVYLASLEQVLNDGQSRLDRTGTGTRSIFGCQMRFDISEYMPVITTKQLPWKHCIKELLWFLSGSTDAQLLQSQGVKIWDGNSSRAFLDGRGLTELPEGDIGPGYGFQWRHFGAEYATCKDDYAGKGTDQIAQVLDMLKTDPFSRRIFFTAWNPASLDKMALPPCHVSAQFYVTEQDGQRKLSCHMYQRSVDLFLGEPWNILSYAVMTALFAKLTDMTPHELIISTGDTHIYNDHVEQVKLQLSREPFPPPKLIISDAVKEKPLEQITLADFELTDYNHHPAIKATMSV